MSIITYEGQFKRLFGDIPKYRLKQIYTAQFGGDCDSWQSISTLPQTMRDKLGDILWISVRAITIQESANKDTYKAVLEGYDDKKFETVLMRNKKEQWSICVSSQVGCAMKCTFCATGDMGLKRSLTEDEIADQYRFWFEFLCKNNLPNPRISNVVFMGMGEPMANYDNVKIAIHRWLDYTDLGPTKITVSTVGVLSQMRRLLDDPDWPIVKIAISLHSADQTRREEIVPTTPPDFLKKIIDWSHEYNNKLGNRSHHITYEYTLLAGVNDSLEDAKLLGSFVRKTAFSKVNVIPYNPVKGKLFSRTDIERKTIFKDTLRLMGINVTERKTMGDDIDAACGQLSIS